MTESGSETLPADAVTCVVVTCPGVKTEILAKNCRQDLLGAAPSGFRLNFVASWRTLCVTFLTRNVKVVITLVPSHVHASGS